MKAKLTIFLTAIILLVFCGCANSMTKLSFPKDFETSVLKYSAENNLSPCLVYGIIKRESKFVHDAESDKGAKGLMQLKTSTAQWTAERIGMQNFKEGDLLDPDTNIRLGCAYFSYLMQVYEGNVKLALCAYNAGMGNVDLWINNDIVNKENVDVEKIPYDETKNYVKDVLEYADKYKELYPELG